jgi:hypothetical protein
LLPFEPEEPPDAALSERLLPLVAPPWSLDPDRLPLAAAPRPVAELDWAVDSARVFEAAPRTVSSLTAERFAAGRAASWVCLPCVVVLRAADWGDAVCAVEAFDACGWETELAALLVWLGVVAFVGFWTGVRACGLAGGISMPGPTGARAGVKKLGGASGTTMTCRSDRVSPFSAADSQPRTSQLVLSAMLSGGIGSTRLTAALISRSTRWRSRSTASASGCGSEAVTSGSAPIGLARARALSISLISDTTGWLPAARALTSGSGLRARSTRRALSTRSSSDDASCRLLVALDDPVATGSGFSVLSTMRALSTNSSSDPTMGWLKVVVDVSGNFDCGARAVVVDASGTFDCGARAANCVGGPMSSAAGEDAGKDAGKDAGRPPWSPAKTEGCEAPTDCDGVAAAGGS